MRWWVWWSSAMASLLLSAEANRVLLLYPISSRSHANFFGGITDALIDQGLQVMAVTPYNNSKQREGFSQVVLPKGDVTAMYGNLFDTKIAKLAPTRLAMRSITLCSEVLETKEAQDLVNQEFDIVLLSGFFSECFLSIVHQLQVPFIWVSSIRSTAQLTTNLGSPQFPAFTPTLFIPAAPPFTFLQRMENVLFEAIGSMAYDHYILPRMESECRAQGLCRPEMPNLVQLVHNASLGLFNHIANLDQVARPKMPTEVECGGIHVRPGHALPQDLQQWVQDSSHHGFIFLSFGTNVKPSDMPQEYRKAMLEVFASLEQRVLWKWDEDTMEGLPPNVRLAKWLPQQDVLADPHLRLFITHGGLFSLQEATYHGVPVLGLPVFLDQHNNMVDAKAHGWATYLLWTDLTAHTFKDAIQFAMSDEKTRARVKQRARVMRNQQVQPAKVAAYWVEYVIRHGGATHLRSPATDMSWFVLYNMDVWAVVIAVVLLITYLFIRLCSAFFNSFCCPSPKIRSD